MCIKSHGVKHRQFTHCLFFDKKKKQNEFQAEQTNSRKESIPEGYAKLKNNISSATQAVYAIGRSVKLLYHPLSVFLTAQML